MRGLFCPALFMQSAGRIMKTGKFNFKSMRQLRDEGKIMKNYVTIHIYIYTHIYIYIYSVSQKWVYPSHFSKYLSISLHGTTLTKWHFDTMKGSLCAAYRTELIYFPLKIAQNITIKSKTPANKSEYTPK